MRALRIDKSLQEAAHSHEHQHAGVFILDLYITVHVCL